MTGLDDRWNKEFHNKDANDDVKQEQERNEKEINLDLSIAPSTYEEWTTKLLEKRKNLEVTIKKEYASIMAIYPINNIC
jgi:hypothetical protein